MVKLKALSGGKATPAPTVSRGAEPPDEPELLEHAERLRDAVKLYSARVFRVLRRAGLGASDAEDAAQDVFWILAQRVRDVPPRAELSFLLTTALRVAADRRRSVWHRSVTEPLDPSWPSTLPPQDEALGLRQRLGFLDRALELLEPAERAVFVLAELEELTREQTAAILSIPEGTVATRLRKARVTFERAVARLLRETPKP
ncbi:MAG: sigma-70 family RNA polymerase sigma factor [Polyangiaceae bacterium]